MENRIGALCQCQTSNCRPVESFTLNSIGERRDLADSLWQQQRQGRHCDVIIKQGDNRVPCHRCVLAVQSGYFQALFSENFNNENTKEYDLPPTPCYCVDKLLQYIYLGQLHLELDELESVYMLADYLCITDLIKECQKFLIQTTNCHTWYTNIEIAIKFGINDVINAVVEFISPNITSLLSEGNMKSLQLSPATVKELLNDHRINYTYEYTIARFLCNWAKYNPTDNMTCAKEQMRTVNPNYFPKAELQNILKDSDFTDLLSDEFKEVSDKRLQLCRNLMLVCRSRINNTESSVKLMCFDLDTYQWSPLNAPNNITLQGLQTMVKHRDHIYFLSSLPSDFCGYMHSAQEKKQLFSLNITNGEWHNLPPPNRVNHQFQLISHINGIFVADKYGIVEMFDDATSSWFDGGTTIYSTMPAATLHFLPMPMDRYIYFLRIFDLGYSPEYAEFTLAIHIYDTISGTSRLLSDIDSSELDLESNERFYNYSIVPGMIFLKNSLGQTRVQFDMASHSWERKDTTCPLPKCFGTIWGSVQFINKCYLVTNSHPNRQFFAVYDWGTSQLKALPSPDCQISGLMVCTPKLPGCPNS